MDDLVQTPTAWDAAAADYERMFDRFTAKYADEALHLTGFDPAWRVLDVAAGCGNLSIIAARRGASVVAIDFSPGMIERLRARAVLEKMSNITAEVMDGQDLAFPDGSFDAAYSVFGLIFFPDRQRGLRELRRVLKGGGRTAIVAWSVPERMGWPPVVRRALQAVVPGFVPPRRSWHELQDPAVLETEIRRAGFEHVAIEAVTKKWIIPSAEALWSSFRSMSPPTALLFETLSEDAVRAFGDVFVDELKRTFGDGPITFEAEALVAVADR